MSANTIITSIVTAGSNVHTTTSTEANAVATDFITQGVVGAITLNAGSGGTGSFCVNADASPDMGITVKAGQAYITATPSSQGSQVLRASAAADYTAYTINSNSSGSTKYDWIYLSVSATNANNPSATADNVTSIVTSRSSLNTLDNGSPPTYGILLAIVTVANGASSITNSNITDSRSAAVIGNASSALTTFLTAGTFDFVASGCVLSGDSYASTLNGSMTSGVVYIGGSRNTVPAFSAHAFGASLDTYVDALYSSTGIATIVYTGVANNAASPALAANSIRLGIVVAGGTAIAAVASINQGQETKVLPIASSIPYQVTDSLGNLICPCDPTRRVLGQRMITAAFQTSSTNSNVDVTGLNVPVIVPANRKIKISVFSSSFNMSGGTPGSRYTSIIEGSTIITHNQADNTAQYRTSVNVTTPAMTVSTGAHTYKVSIQQNSAGTATFDADSTYPAYILVELA